MKKAKQRFYAVICVEPYEGPKEITLYRTKRAAEKNCPAHDCYWVVGPIVVGEQVSLYGL